MGQYYYIVNLDKKQYLHPHNFGDGLKLLEFGLSRDTLSGLTILLADGNNRGGGDLQSDNPIIGSWAGDRIVIAGDYADPDKFVSEEDIKICKKAYFLKEKEQLDDDDEINLHSIAYYAYENISVKVIEALCDDQWFFEEFVQSLKRDRDSEHYSLGYNEHIKKFPEKLQARIRVAIPK